jgi:hypothetical protein
VQSKKEYYKTLGEAMEPITLKPREMEVWQRFPEKKWLTVKKEMME